MTVLISNDDGIHAEGILVLADTLQRYTPIKVVAPDRDHSGASGSLTLSRPLKITRLRNGYCCVDGTPTDSVHVGLSELFDCTFDRVVAGINSHENLGDDVLYSGTVAAAIEGRFLPFAPIAVSLANRGHFYYQTAAMVIADLLFLRPALNLPPKTILNVNVPDIPYESLKGLRVTRLGHRSKGKPPEWMADPRGRERVWISTAGGGDDAGVGTDFEAVANDYVSITPIQVDMTHHAVIDKVNQWLEGSNE